MRDIIISVIVGLCVFSPFLLALVTHREARNIVFEDRIKDYEGQDRALMNHK